MDSYAMRFTLGKITFTYSGDTAICKGIQNAANNADYFLCESSINNREGDLITSKAHLSAYQAGQITKKIHVKHLILTHYTGKDLEIEMKKAVEKSGFKGRTSVAKDFQIFPLV